MKVVQGPEVNLPKPDRHAVAAPREDGAIACKCGERCELPAYAYPKKASRSAALPAGFFSECLNTAMPSSRSSFSATSPAKGTDESAHPPALSTMRPPPVWYEEPPSPSGSNWNSPAELLNSTTLPSNAALH